ncbi:MAG: hypothetical protein AB9846_01010 [Tenuifilaceae bacterium]
MNTTEIRKIFIWITLFSIAMAFLETSVVVYLRALYYPEGFNFPLKMLDKNIAIVEIFREFATIVMLLGAGFIAGRTKTEKFGLFLYSFAVWDIFYYIFLKVILNWPESLLTWDVLFLIPTTWVGPVIAPVIISFVMIAFATFISRFTSRNLGTRINPIEWILLISGSLVLIIGFVYDYVKFMLQFFNFLEIFSPSNITKLMEKALIYVPINFPWLIFIIGLGIILGGIGLFYRRNKRHK